MFVFLLVAVGLLFRTLSVSLEDLEDRSEYMQGVVLTAVTGGIGALLTLVSIIVKGLVDNLTRKDNN